MDHARRNCREGEGKEMAKTSASGSDSEKRTHPLEEADESDPLSNYFSMKSFGVLVLVTLSLLLLPLILPPLPPPPSLLLLLPIAILAVLMVLVFMPSDVRNIAAAYL